MKVMLRNMLRRVGYDVQPYQTYKGRAFPERPWEDDTTFLKIYEQVRFYTILDRRRLYMLYQLACNATTLKGHFAECGVYRGGSAVLFALIKAANTNLYLFDTFTGMPETNHIRDYHRAKDFCDTSYEKVRKLLGPYANVKLRKGFFPQTTKGLETTVFSLVHVDFDIYQSMFDACNFFYPRLVRGGYMIFDDYGSPSCPGAKQAVQEFCSANGAREIYLPTGQALLCNFESSIC